MKSVYIKNLAVIPYARFETLFYQTLEDTLQKNVDDNLSQVAVAKMLKNNLQCEELFIQKDIRLTEEELQTWLKKFGNRLRSEEIALCFVQTISDQDITLKQALSMFSTIYAENLLNKGSKVLLNTAFGFKAGNIKEAIQNRAKTSVSDAYTSKLLILNGEYFHYENSRARYGSFTEYRKEFMHQFFCTLHSYEDKLSKETFNKLFNNFV